MIEVTLRYLFNEESPSTVVAAVLLFVAVTVHVDSVRGVMVMVVGVQSVVTPRSPCPRVNATGRCRS